MQNNNDNKDITHSRHARSHITLYYLTAQLTLSMQTYFARHQIVAARKQMGK